MVHKSRDYKLAEKLEKPRIKLEDSIRKYRDEWGITALKDFVKYLEEEEK